MVAFSGKGGQVIIGPDNGVASHFFPDLVSHIQDSQDGKSIFLFDDINARFAMTTATQ